MYISTANSACLGGAYIARNGTCCHLYHFILNITLILFYSHYSIAVTMGPNLPFEQVVTATEESRKVASPRQHAHEVYRKMSATYAELEERVLKNYDAEL